MSSPAPVAAQFKLPTPTGPTERFYFRHSMDVLRFFFSLPPILLIIASITFMFHDFTKYRHPVQTRYADQKDKMEERLYSVFLSSLCSLLFSALLRHFENIVFSVS